MRLNIINTMIRSIFYKDTIFEAKIEGTSCLSSYP